MGPELHAAAVISGRMVLESLNDELHLLDGNPCLVLHGRMEFGGEVSEDKSILRRQSDSIAHAEDVLFAVAELVLNWWL